MPNIPAGYQNEFLFVLEFNNKKVKELNPLLREVIDDIFPNCHEDSLIKSWRNHLNYQKGDIMVKIDDIIKSISIKMGSKNSVHVQKLESFEKLLKSQGINNRIIEYYKNFHYGIDIRDKEKTLSSKEFSSQYPKIIKKINKYFRKIDIDKIIDGFILRGRFSKSSVAGIIYGTPNDFLWINKNDIISIIKQTQNRKSTTVHIGCLYIQPLNRCINHNNKYEWAKDYIQVKWYSLFDDIIEYKNKICYNQNRE